MAGATDTGKEIVEEVKTAPIDELKGPEDEDSLASILEKTELPTFTGHPALGGEEGADPGQEDEAAKPPEETPEGGEKPPEDKTPPEEEIPEGWEFKPKYKDHQEAEKGAREHQKKVTEATEETKREREAREAAERERDELKEKLAEKEAAKPPEPPAKTPEEVEAEQEARIESALEEIGGLDEADPEYKKKVARAWRKAGVGGAGQPAIPNTEEIANLVDQRVEEKLKAKDEAARQKDETDREKKEIAEIRTTAGKQAAEAGLDMEEGTADYRLFWDVAGDLPSDLKGKPLAEQVEWAVGEVRRLTGKVVQVSEEAKKKAKETQINNAVLERGSTRPKPPEKPEPYSLGSILNKQQEGRRI